MPAGTSVAASAHAVAGTDPWPIHAREAEEENKKCNVCHFPQPFAIPDAHRRRDHEAGPAPGGAGARASPARLPPHARGQDPRAPPGHGRAARDRRRRADVQLRDVRVLPRDGQARPRQADADLPRVARRLRRPRPRPPAVPGLPHAAHAAKDGGGLRRARPRRRAPPVDGRALRPAARERALARHGPAAERPRRGGAPPHQRRRRATPSRPARTGAPSTSRRGSSIARGRSSPGASGCSRPGTARAPTIARS